MLTHIGPMEIGTTLLVLGPALPGAHRAHAIDVDLRRAESLRADERLELV
jgi:predicted RNA methylase